MKATLIFLTLTFFIIGCSSKRRQEDAARKKDKSMAEKVQSQQSSEKATDEEAKGAMEEPKADTPHPYKMHWSYKGEMGPENWGDLREEYKLCKEGKLQSPIDLKFKRPQPDRKIEFDYNHSPLKVIDNGHTIKVSFTPGSRLFVMGKQYELVQMHFHSSSEHTLSGNSLPLEAQLVHRNELGQLAIVGIMLIEGRKHPLIEKIWSHIPEQKHTERLVPNETVNAKDILPDRFTHYHYVGSLTTPPCTEGVRWYVLNTPVEVSREQILQFRKLYSHNSRPVQPLNGRNVTNY